MTALDVDEMIAQLLVSEGFETLEEVGYVAQDELTAIEGFDEETAEELQTRAREFLERQAAEQDATRKAAGVEDDVLEIEGVTLPMAVAFGENDIKTVEDVAGLVPDDLRGYTETAKDGTETKEHGILESFGLSNDAATDMIMQARIKAGWIDPADLEPEPELDEDGNPIEIAEVVEA